MADERRALIERRQHLGIAACADVHLEALTGMALSGGGIRSATFCLGVLQSLDRAGVLPAFDYLSSVSGGGFVGAWWTAWIARDQSGELCNQNGDQRHSFPPVEGIAPDRLAVAERTLASGLSKQEVESDYRSSGRDPIHHLRLYANFVTPRRGWLSADTWQAFATVCRDLLLTNAILLPILLVAVLFADLYFVYFDPSWIEHDVDLFEQAAQFRARSRLGLWALPVLALAGWFVVVAAAWVACARGNHFARVGPPIALALASLFLAALLYTPGPPGAAATVETSRLEAMWQWLTSWGRFLSGSTPGRLLGGWSLCAVVLYTHVTSQLSRGVSGEGLLFVVTRLQTRLLVLFCFISITLGIAGFGHELVLYARYAAAPENALLAFIKENGGWVAIMSAIAGSIFTAIRASPSTTTDALSVSQPSHLANFIFALTPPLVVFLLMLGMTLVAHETILHVADGRRSGTALRLLTFGSVMFVLMCILSAWSECDSKGAEASLPQQRPARAAVWALALLGALASLGTVGVPRTPVLFLAAATSVLSFTALRQRLLFTGNTRPAWLVGVGSAMTSALVLPSAVELPVPVAVTIGLIGSTLAWVFSFGWFVNPNATSLHGFYRSRLISAYLGASNRHRGKQLKPVEQFDGLDDILLADATSWRSGGPLHLVNATLNLTAGRDLSSTQRSSDRFLLSPLYCGSARTGYRRTSAYMSGTLSLGTAMAISGAAVSPTMGGLSPTASLAMLLTMLNVRLGFWAPTPNKIRWREPTASLWPVYLIFELLSQTNELADYCYLTDGGHFDNTGLYSLIERGCRNVLLLDCGADPKPCFEDLGTAIRRCRIDFGTEIDVDLERLMKPDQKENDRRQRHYVVGTIRYGERHAERLGMSDVQRVGVLIVLKPLLGGGEPADVSQYAFQNKAFPHQVTADQWFDESQFESYRKLGEHAAGSMLKDMDPLARLWDLEGGETPSPGEINRVFDSLRQRESYGVPPTDPANTPQP